MKYFRTWSNSREIVLQPEMKKKRLMTRGRTIISLFLGTFICTLNMYIILKFLYHNLQSYVRKVIVLIRNSLSDTFVGIRLIHRNVYEFYVSINICILCIIRIHTYV